MTAIQLSPSIPLITPYGGAEAIMMFEYSKEDYVYFLCIQDDTGELWLWDNTRLRGFKNISINRNNISPIKPIPSL